MPNIRQINKADDIALVNIVLDYIRGHSIDEITLRLKEQCLKFDKACQSRYEAIKPNMSGSEFNNAVNKILDELAVGGSQLHVMTVSQAKIEEKFNCYVWDEQAQTLTYLQYKKNDTIIQLNNSTPLIEFINIHNKPTTLHLTAQQIKDKITLNSQEEHFPQHTATPAEIQDYKSLPNLYSVLKRLESRHPHLTILIDKINKATPPRNWWLYLMFATGLTAATGLIFYLKENFALVRAWYERTMPIVSRLLNNTVYLLSKTPLIGVISHGLPLIASWYQAIRDGSITEAKKIIKLSFKTIEHTLPLVGYLLCYLAAGVMTVPAVALFITGASIEIIEALYDLTYHQIEPWFNPLAPATEYHSATARACADNKRELSLYVSLVKITANLFTTASVIIWCIFPPSLMVALTCILFSTLTGLTKSSLINGMKNNYANALQTELSDICDQYNVPQHTEKNLENLELKQKNQQLVEKNLSLEAQVALYEKIVTNGFIIRNGRGFFDSTNTAANSGSVNSTETEGMTGSQEVGYNSLT